MRRHLPAVIGLALLPVIASAVVLIGATRDDPALLVMFLSKHLSPGFIPGSQGFFDPTVGLITQPLGMLSAKDWLAGTIPWWNPYTGVGMPLAAEMQPMSFFLPFVLLLRFWHGWLALKLVLQAFSGIAAYALMIELRTTRLAAFITGAFFALNATFFMVPHAMGPLPFAPLLLLGIERSARFARLRRPLGWGLIPLAVAWSIYAGYPEVAYLDALLAALWALWRFATLGEARWRFAFRIVLGGLLGAALALPLVVPFLAYVGQSVLSQHGYDYGHIWLLPEGAPLAAFPFAYGPQFLPAPAGVPGRQAYFLAGYLTQLGGWFGPAALLLALAAVARAITGPVARRGLILLLGLFILFWQLRLWGMGYDDVRPAIFLADLIPGVAATDTMRFVWPAMELACFVLAGLAVDHWQREGGLGWRAGVLTAIFAIVVGLVSVLPAWPTLTAWFQGAPERLPFALMATGGEVAVAALAFLLIATRGGRIAAVCLGTILVADALGVASLPQFAAPRTGRVDLAGVRYLQGHLGRDDAALDRFYSLQPFGPNYPAAFRLASIDDNALPVQRSWRDYIRRHLDPYADVVMFTGSQARSLHCVVLPERRAALLAGVFLRPDKVLLPPDQSAELRRHLAAYAATGVRYVIAPPGADPFTATARPPVDPQPARPLVLDAGQSVSFTVPPGLIPLRRISRIGVLIGTYRGASTGSLLARLCAGTDCASGRAALATARDNHRLTVTLDHAIAVRPDQRLVVGFGHGPGRRVALWLGRLDPAAPATLTPAGAPAGYAPIVDFTEAPASPAPRLVFHDSTMNLYRLPASRPFFSTIPACRLTPHGWNRVTADCPAPATLLRLEAFYPGWRARIGPHSVPIGRAEGMFQSITLPAGRSEVRFVYRPPLVRPAVAVALAALLLWLVLLLAGGRGRGGREAHL